MEKLVAWKSLSARMLPFKKISIGATLVFGLVFAINICVFPRQKDSVQTAEKKSDSSVREPAGELITILDAHGPIAFCPGRKRLILATGSEVLDVRDNKVLYKVPFKTGKGAGVHYVFSPDGKLVATACSPDRELPTDRDRELRVRDATTGKNLTLLNQSAKRVSAFVFSPDSKYLAETCGHDINIWDASSGKEVRRLHHKIAFPEYMVYHPDGKLLVSESDGDLYFWDVEKECLLCTLSPLQEHGIYHPAISPDGKLLAAVDSRQEDNTGYHLKSAIRLWELPSRKEVGVLPEQTGPFRKIAFHRNGRWLASIGGDRTVKLWDIPKRKLLRTIPLETIGIYLAFSPDGRLLATAEERHIKLWDLAPDGPKQP